MKRRDLLMAGAGGALATLMPSLAAPTLVTGAQAQSGSSLDKIKHVVVLMLENRSFDCMLGMLYPKSAKFDGLAGTESNHDLDGRPIRVNNRPGHSVAALTRPNPKPGEFWRDINEQLFGSPDPPAPGQVPTMNGFVRNYLLQVGKPAAAYDPAHIMNYFTPDQVPVLSGLAKAFTVSDRWFSSAPCQTWPNRFFATCGTHGGHEDNLPLHLPYRMPTIFERLDKIDPVNGWRVYFHDAAHAHSLTRLWTSLRKFKRFPRFIEDARNGRLPVYSYIEPNYFRLTFPRNDGHPPSNITLGEKLLADTYNAVRQGPAWKETLLIVLFDEHGGCYDHVPPPAAVPPTAVPIAPFNFDRFGVRVPAIFISPYVPAGIVLRAAGPTPYDHTSILATLRRRFDLGPPLGPRDAAAPDLASALSLPEPTNPGPAQVDPLPLEDASGPSLRAGPGPQSGPQTGDDDGVDDLQAALEGLSRRLPVHGTDVEAHIRALLASGTRIRRSASTSSRAVAAAVDARVRRFLGE